MKPSFNLTAREQLISGKTIFFALSFLMTLLAFFNNK